MKFILIALIILTSLGFTEWHDDASQFEQSTETSTEEMPELSSKAKLYARLSHIVADEAQPLAGLSVVVLQDGEPVFEGYFGNRYYTTPPSTANDLPMTSNTRMRIASISKLVTAIGLMQLVERDLVGLSADVSEYLGFTLRNPAFPDTPITVESLLSHTSSVRDSSQYILPATRPISAFFDPGEPEWGDGEHWATSEDQNSMEPGEFFHYSGLNFGLIATIIERISGERFDQYMNNHVLGPLGIGGSYNVMDFDALGLDDLAALYRLNDQGTWVANVDNYRETRVPTDPEGLDSYVIGTNGTVFSPGAGLRVSAVELARIAQMFFEGGTLHVNQILEEATISDMFSLRWEYDSVENNGDSFWGLMHAYGLSVHCTTDSEGGDRLVSEGGLMLCGHIGMEYGLISILLIDIEKKAGFIYLISGTPEELEFGEYSVFFLPEEHIMQAIYDEYLSSVFQ